MASFAYTRAKRDLGLGDLHLDTDDIRTILVQTASTADADEDSATISAIGTLSEATATGYARVAMANEAFNEDTVNDRGEFTSDAVAFGAIGNGTNNNIKGMIIYKHVTNDTDSIPLFYIDLNALNGSSDVATNGGTLTITPNAEGWAQIT